MGWTKGKWQVVSHIDGGKTVQDSERYLIATVAEYDEDGAAKHAHLIAAAPELLEALAYIYEDVRQGALPDDNDPWYERAAAVLAKAKGEI